MGRKADLTEAGDVSAWCPGIGRVFRAHQRTQAQICILGPAPRGWSYLESVILMAGSGEMWDLGRPSAYRAERWHQQSRVNVSPGTCVLWSCLHPRWGSSLLYFRVLCNAQLI